MPSSARKKQPPDRGQLDLGEPPAEPLARGVLPRQSDARERREAPRAGDGAAGRDGERGVSRPGPRRHAQEPEREMDPHEGLAGAARAALPARGRGRRRPLPALARRLVRVRRADRAQRGPALMQIVAYEPSLFSALAAAARGAAAGHSLGHRPFVDHYYATVPWCRLYLALGDDGAVAGAIGVEQLRFEYEGRPLTIGCASNFVAFQPGAGGVLFLRWIRSSEMACIYGGSRDTHRILAHQGWTYFPGVHVYSLNGRYTDRPAEPRWRGVAKSVLRAVTPRVDVGERLRGVVARGVVPAVNVAEVGGFDADMLPRAGGFMFRLAPGTEYLGWRYSPALPFVRYRLFRLPRGYVVLNERPGRIVVAQADATDPASLVRGGARADRRALARVRRSRERAVVLRYHAITD